MLRIASDLRSRLEGAIRRAQAAEEFPVFNIPNIPVVAARSPEFGDYASPIALGLARTVRNNPEVIANIIVGHIDDISYVDSISVDGGYINFKLADSWVQAQVDSIIYAGEQIVQMDDFAGKRAQVECVSANPTGPLHVGRIRGGIIGDTMARLLRAMGYSVEMEYYYNNAGKQMDKLALSLYARYRESLGLSYEFPPDHYRGTYLLEVAQTLVAEYGDSLAESFDKEFFRSYAENAIAPEQKESLKRINITFDTSFNENTLYGSPVEAVLEQLKERDLLYKSRTPNRREDTDETPNQEILEATATGEATWLKVMALRDAPHDVALVRSDGSPTYRLPDIAYHVNKYERGFDYLLNILGADHIEEAKDIKAVMGGLGYDPGLLQHIIHQFVKVIHGAEVISGSTRAGDFVAIGDLIDMVMENTTESFAVDAIRYYYLVRSPNTELVIDINEVGRQSSENPVYYIQNAYVRSLSIAREAEARGFSLDGGDSSRLSDPRELALIKKMLELPDVIELVVSMLEPHKMADWAYKLARVFHPTYEDIRALHGDVPEDLARARLKLYKAAEIVFRRVLELMGMTAPQRM